MLRVPQRPVVRGRNLLQGGSLELQAMGRESGGGGQLPQIKLECQDHPLPQKTPTRTHHAANNALLNSTPLPKKLPGKLIPPSLFVPKKENT